MDARSSLQVVGFASLLLGFGGLGAGVELGRSVMLVVMGALLLFTSLAVRRSDSATAMFPSRRIVLIATAVGGAGIALDLLGAFLVAEGEASGHALFHTIVGAACMALFLILGSVWKPSGNSMAAIFRASLLIALWVSSMAVLLEGLGAGGYDVNNAGRRFPTLVTLHNSVTGIAGFALILFPVVVIVLTVVLVRLAWQRTNNRQEASAS